MSIFTQLPAVVLVDDIEFELTVTKVLVGKKKKEIISIAYASYKVVTVRQHRTSKKVRAIDQYLFVETGSNEEIACKKAIRALKRFSSIRNK